MDSLDDIIEDMEDLIDTIEVHDWFMREVLTFYLTRLKALRELTDKKEEDESK
jgi:hypothetical protein